MIFFVTEDDFVAREILINYLQKYGSVDVATDGVETVEAINMLLTKMTHIL